MKKYFGWAVLALIVSLGCYYSGSVIAQGPGGPAYGPSMAGAAPKIVLIDINYIFKNLARFKGMMTDMKNDVKRAEENVNAEKMRIDQLMKKLQEYQKGTPDYRAMDEDITRAKAELAVKFQGQKNDFLQQEAQIYNTIYQEILQETDYFCKQNGCEMVLRFNGDPVDPQRPDSVLTFINRPVVWYQQGVDITPIVLKALNNRAPVSGGAGAPGAGGGPAGPVSSRPMLPFGANPVTPRG